MGLHDFYIVITAFFSEIIGTISGFGSSTFFVPAAQFFENFKLVLVLTAILHTFANLSRLWIFRQSLKNQLFMKLAVPSVLLTGLGALMTNLVDTEVLQKALGIGLMIISTAAFLKKIHLNQNSKWQATFITAISGFLTGFIGTGGALRGAALSLLHIEKEMYVALSSGIDVGGDILRLIIYLKNGFMDWQQWHYIPLLAIAAYLGTRIGKKLLSKINQEHFNKLVAVLIFISGIGLVLQS